MTDAVKKRYEDAFDRLTAIVDNTAVETKHIQALIRDTAAKIAEALDKAPDADIDDIINDFRNAVEAIVMENMRMAAHEAEDEDEDFADVSLALTFANIDISTPVQRYSEALSQEVKWFIAGGFAVSAIYDFIKDPIGFIGAESMKPAQSGTIKKQTAGRMTLAPVFMGGKRRRSFSDVVADFRDSVPAVGIGNSFKVGSSTWMLLNTTAMRAYNDALAMKWSYGGKIVGYYVFRGSDYDCPACDEQCGFIHPLTEMVLPVHPRCLCFCVEAYAGESTSDFEI